MHLRAELICIPDSRVSGRIQSLQLAGRRGEKMADSENPLDFEQRVYLERARVHIEQGRGRQLRAAAAAFFIGLSLFTSNLQ